MGCSIKAEMTASLRRTLGGFRLLFVERLFPLPCSPVSARSWCQWILQPFREAVGLRAGHAYTTEQKGLVTLQMAQIEKL